MRPALAALACLYFAAHLAFLPKTLEDIDTVNFALGVVDFDVARHQPHPPGYPVFIAIAKALAAVLGGGAEGIVTALALASVLAGAALVPLLFALFRGLGGGGRRAWWGMALALACPLFWFTALRPLSDMTGLAAAVAAQGLILAAIAAPAGDARLLAAGAFAAGLAAGIRAQTAVLTGPLLLAVLVLPSRVPTLRARLAGVAGLLGGIAVWLVPLVAASGGPGGYLAALGTQAGEDFTGVVMLWTTRSPRVAADALVYSFLWPWGSLVFGAIVLAVAAAGIVRLLLRRELGSLVWLAIVFGPYAVFHLLFHETATVRYALPLVVPVAYLGAAALEWGGRRAATLLGAAAVVASLAMAVPASRAYAAADAPAFRAMADVRSANLVAMHAVFRRTAEWAPPAGTLLTAPHGREWLGLVERWRADPAAAIAFVSDPRRTDLLLFDPQAREQKGSYRWGFPVLPYVGGVRPGSTDWYLMRPPGWMLDRGWALSAEIGGVSAREGAGPHVAPAVAWVRPRVEPSLLMIGGRNLDGAETTVTLSRDDVELARWRLTPGFFFHLMPVEPAALAGDGYVPLSVRAQAPGADPVRVSLEQFDLQPEGIAMQGFVEGWHEPEYNPLTSRAWRWMSERAVLWVRPVGRDVTLTVTGESPLRYFDAPPAVTVGAAGTEVLRFAPTEDFTREVRLPAALLASAGGKVTLTSDRWFVPAERGGAADRRRLALRIYAVSVR